MITTMRNDIATVTVTFDGHIQGNEAYQELFEVPAEVVIRPEEWCEAFHLYDPVSRLPLTPDRSPGYRTLVEGRVSMEILVARPGAPERVLQVEGEAVYDDEGDPMAAILSGVDITEEFALRDVPVPDCVVTVCPCEEWQVEIPLGTPAAWIEETLRDHMRECIVLTATRMTTYAS